MAKFPVKQRGSDTDTEVRAMEYATENTPAWLAGERLPPEYRALIALMLRDAWLAGATETTGERTR
jgi:hypothetical protein